MANKGFPISDSMKNARLNYIFSFISFIEMVTASFVTLTFAPDQKNAWLLGYSFNRWVLMLSSFLLGIGIIIFGIIAYKRKTTFAIIIQNKVGAFGKKIFAVITFILVLWGWCSAFCPSYLFGIGGYTYERLRPLSIAIGLTLLQYSLLYLFSNRKINFRSLKSSIKHNSAFRASAFFAVCLLALTIFIGTTKIGLVKDTPYWNVPGMPLSGLQFLAVILILTLGMYFLPGNEKSTSSTKLSKLYRFLPLLIYIVTILVWGFTPMLKQYFSLQPMLPNNQPFPSSDARIYDRMSINILNGEKHIFQNSTNKPLYIVFLAFLHLFAGYDYNLMVWLQITVLAFIPVILYFFGKRFHSQGFGFFLALITIIRQRNAIVLSYKIASANPKLLTTEVMMLLGVVLLVYLVFLWFRTNKLWLALLSGGVVGAISLIRLNSLILFPVIACFALVALPKFPINKWRHLVFYTLGFLILFVPWLFTGVHAKTGIPWALEHPLSVISSRYLNKSVDSAPESVSTGVSPGITQTPIQTPISTSTPKKDVTPRGTISIEITPEFTQTPMPLSISTVIPKTKTTTVTVSTAVTPGLTQTPIPLSEAADTSSPDSQDTLEKNSFLDLFINHFLHNYSTSLLSLPDSLIYDDLFHLADREYWIDFYPWQGNLPLPQILLILLNAILIAVGLGYSWQKYRWIGLVPMVVFIGYSISLALVVTSGSRYIVPIDWILYFYYGLAIILIIRKVTNFIRGERESSLDPVETDPLKPASDQKRFWLVFIGLVVFASFIPLANLGIPTSFSAPVDKPQLESLIQSISTNQDDKADITYGEILYPYYKDDGTFVFDFLVDGKFTTHVIDIKQNPLEISLYGGERLILVTQGNNKEIIIDSIYLVDENSATSIWEHSSDF